ncbi:MAG: protein disulfide oxidoreductase [Neisseriaceae bacterium]
MTMTTKLGRWLKSVLKWALLFVLISTAVDWYRRPVQPEPQAYHLRNLAGQSFSLAERSQTEPIVLYFWGTWCPICTLTSPNMQQLVDAGIPVISVAMQSGDDATVAEYLAEKGYAFETVNDADGALSSLWGVKVTPTVVIVYQGKMQASVTGYTSYWGMRARLWLERIL